VALTITNKATPDQISAVMKLVNFVYTVRGTTMLDFGPEGKYWTWAKKGQLGLDGRQALINVQWGKFYSGTALQNWGWDQMGPIYQSEAWRDGGVALPEWSPNGLATMLSDMTVQFYAGHQPQEVFPAAIWIPPSQEQQYEMTRTNINNFVSQWTDQFIVGTKNLDKDWNTYVQGVQHLGLQQYLQMAQSAMGKPFDTSAFKGGVKHG
jgi:putative aldouronate transport system substrate-binding protein